MVDKCRKWAACLIVLIMLLGSCSCNNKGKENSDTVNRRHGYNIRDIARSGDGIFYKGDDELVHFYSTSAGGDTLICFEPTCEHKPASKLNPDPVCKAALFDAVARIAYYEDNLYYLVRDGAFDTKIYRMNIGGGTRELVAEIPYSFKVPCSVVFEGDYMYYVADVNELPEDSFVLDTYREIIEVNILDGSHRLVTSGGQTDYANFIEFDVYGKNLYAEVMLSSKEGAYNIIVDLETYDMTTVKGDEYMERQYIGPYDEESYYYCNYNTDEIGIYNMTTEDREVLFKIKEQYYSSVMASDREIFYKTGLDGDFSYFFYDVVKDELTEITDQCIDRDIAFYDGYSNIFIGYKTEPHEGGGRNIIGYTAYGLEEIVGE